MAVSSIIVQKQVKFAEYCKFFEAMRCDELHSKVISIGEILLEPKLISVLEVIV